VKEHLRVEQRRQEIEARRGTLGDLLLGYVAHLDANGKVSARKVELALRKRVERANRSLWRTQKRPNARTLRKCICSRL